MPKIDKHAGFPTTPEVKPERRVHSAFQLLPETWRVLIEEFEATGNAARAAEKAGLSPRYGRQLLQEHPQVRAVLHMRLRERLPKAGVEAFRKMLGLMNTAKSERVQFEAAKYLLEQALGLSGEMGQRVLTKEAEREVVGRIKELLKDLGLLATVVEGKVDGPGEGAGGA